MSKIVVVADVPAIKLYIPGGMNESKTKGTYIGHWQYFKEVSLKLLYDSSLATT